MKKNIKIYILILILIYFIGINTNKLIQSFFFINYRLLSKKNSIKSLKTPTIIICTHRVGIEYIERIIINSEVYKSDIPVNLILKNTIYNRMFNIFTKIGSRNKYIYVTDNTVNKAIRSINNGNHVLTFIYKDQYKSRSGIYYIVKKTKAPIIVVNIKHYNKVGLLNTYSVNYKKYNYNINDSKEIFLKKLDSNLFDN